MSGKIDDFKILKKKYGESFAKFCRENFPTILRFDGLLTEIITENFNECDYLYDDLIRFEYTGDFISFIFSKYNEKVEEKKLELTEQEQRELLTPAELLDSVGYTLYECKTDEDVKSFMKYYSSEELLCTFRDSRRINRYHIFFAVKKHVEEIERSDNPQRQDEYGTSVISIQFLKGENNIVSIKNRYNHTVEDPDSTFNNNLDEIVPGLRQSFAKYFNLTLSNGDAVLLIPKYVLASDGKRYRFNYEINNIYYCPDNVIIKDGEIIRFDKSRYEMFDYFIFDKVEKKFVSFDETLKDSFTDGIKNIQKIETSVDRKKDERTLKITYRDTPDGKDKYVIITTNNYGCMTKLYTDNKPETVYPYLGEVLYISEIEAPNITMLPSSSLKDPYIKKIKMDNLEVVGEKCFRIVPSLEELSLPKVRLIGNESFVNVCTMKSLSIPECRKIGNDCFYNAGSLEDVEMRKVETIGGGCFQTNGIKRLHLPKLKSVGNFSFCDSNQLESIYIPELETIGDECFMHVNSLRSLYAPKIKKLKVACFKNAKNLRAVKLDSCTSFACRNFTDAPKLQYFSADKLENLGNGSLYTTKELTEISLPSVTSIGAECFEKNNLEKVYFPNLEKCVNDKIYKMLREKGAIIQSDDESVI